MSETDKECKRFLCTYLHDGKQWGFEVFATSFEDAKARLESIGKTGYVDGIYGGEFPVWLEPSSYAARFWVWITAKLKGGIAG